MVVPLGLGPRKRPFDPDHLDQMHIEQLGTRALFLVPSRKVFRNKVPNTAATEKLRVAKLIHDFLMRNFDGFTMASGNINGYFQANEYDEHREYRVAVKEKDLEKLQRFLAEVCIYLDEECIYLEYGTLAMLVYPD